MHYKEYFRDGILTLGRVNLKMYSRPYIILGIKLSFLVVKEIWDKLIEGRQPECKRKKLLLIAKIMGKMKFTILKSELWRVLRWTIVGNNWPLPETDSEPLPSYKVTCTARHSTFGRTSQKNSNSPTHSLKAHLSRSDGRTFYPDNPRWCERRRDTLRKAKIIIQVPNLVADNLIINIGIPNFSIETNILQFPCSKFEWRSNFHINYLDDEFISVYFNQVHYKHQTVPFLKTNSSILWRSFSGYEAALLAKLLSDPSQILSSLPSEISFSTSVSYTHSFEIQFTYEGNKKNIYMQLLFVMRNTALIPTSVTKYFDKRIIWKSNSVLHKK